MTGEGGGGGRGVGGGGRRGGGGGMTGMDEGEGRGERGKGAMGEEVRERGGRRSGREERGAEWAAHGGWCE